MNSTFGVGAGDAVEGFVFREQRVDTFGWGKIGFEAIGALDVPGGEDRSCDILPPLILCI